MMSSFFLNAKEDEARAWCDVRALYTGGNLEFCQCNAPLTNQLLFAWRRTYEFRIIFRGLNTKVSIPGILRA